MSNQDTVGATNESVCSAVNKGDGIRFRYLAFGNVVCRIGCGVGVRRTCGGVIGVCYPSMEVIEVSLIRSVTVV